MTVSATTRDRRAGRAGRPRLLVPRPGEFLARLEPGDFLEHVTYVSGPPLRHAPLRARPDRATRATCPLLELETEGALRVKRDDPRAVTIFISARRRRARAAPAGAGDRERRARSASESPSPGASSSRPISFDHVSRTTIWSGPSRSSRSLVRGLLAPAGTMSPTMIHPRVDDLLQQRRFALCARHRRREARPADQQLPPPARRRHVRRQSAAARGVPLEELPHDGHGGDFRGHADVRLLK